MNEVRLPLTRADNPIARRALGPSPGERVYGLAGVDTGDKELAFAQDLCHHCLGSLLHVGRVVDIACGGAKNQVAPIRQGSKLIRATNAFRASE
jgi:hypothetical protein